MKEIIAKRNKSVFVFFIAIALFSLVLNGWNMQKFLNTEHRWFAIFFLCTIGFIFFVGVTCLVLLPNAAIIKDGENLIVYRGVFKSIIKISDLIDVEEGVRLSPKGKDAKVAKITEIKLTVKSGDEEKIVWVGDIKNKADVVKRLKGIKKD